MPPGLVTVVGALRFRWVQTLFADLATDAAVVGGPSQDSSAVPHDLGGARWPRRVLLGAQRRMVPLPKARRFESSPVHSEAVGIDHRSDGRRPRVHQAFASRQPALS
jgi:hypothetical protein